MANLPATYEFGDVRVETGSALVFRCGAPVPLEPKAFELLVYFIRHRGRLLEKQEILDAVWGETFVSENALTRVVAQLRKALGDDAQAPRYIETAPRRGYRFVADVRSVMKQPGPAGRKRIAFVGAAAVLLILVGAWVLRHGDVEEAARTGRPIQVTSSGALDVFPSLSPDGNSVAFSSNGDGSFEIYVRQLAPGGEEIRITSDGFQNFQPAWSPNGDVIAYYSKKKSGIWTVPAFGGAPRKLTDFGSRPAWSPDGRFIVFQSEPLTDLGANAFGGLAPSTLWIIASDGGTPRQLTKVAEPPGGHGNPAWSPQGDRIAFVTTDLNLSEIWSVSLGGQLRELAAPRMRVYDVVYSPSGNELYFTAFAESSGLWILDLESEGSQPRRLKEATSPTFRYPSVSADGKKLAYAGVVTSSNLASVPLSPDDYGTLGPPRKLTSYTNDRNYYPRFSPDGRTIAFERFLMGAGSDVWLIDADGRNERRLTTHASLADGTPYWSPDGRRVIFPAVREGHWGLRSIDVDSREEEFLRDAPSHWSNLALSPDVMMAAFNSRENGGVINVWVAPMANDGPERQVTFDQELMGWPRWSPDGRLLAFEMKRGANVHIGVVPAGGGTPVQLTSAPGLDWPGDWSPDGDKIAFASWREDAWNLRWVSRTDRRERQLTDYDSLDTFVRYPAWSPRGDQIVYEFAETTGDIWMLEFR